MSVFKNLLSGISRKVFRITLGVALVCWAVIFLFFQTSDRKKSFSSRAGTSDSHQPSEPIQVDGAGKNVSQVVQQAAPLSPVLIRRQAERLQFSWQHGVRENLGIHEGMKILDFGAGSGQYAFLFSKIMKGTGLVYASEISPEAIQYISQEVDRQGIKNIKPVLTDAAKFDPFYKRIKVDLIFMAFVAGHLDDQEEYFSNLKTSLNPKGRLALLVHKPMVNFWKPDAITDLPGLVLFLKRNRSTKAPFTLFGLKVLKAIARSKDGRVAETVRVMIANDLARMLSSDLLMKSFFDERGNIDPALKLLPEEREYAEWFMSFLKDLGPISAQSSEDDKARYGFRRAMINQILVISHFRPFLFNGRATYLPGAKTVSAPVLRDLLVELGYQFEGECNSIPFETLLLFSVPQSEGSEKSVATSNDAAETKQIL